MQTVATALHWVLNLAIGIIFPVSGPENRWPWPLAPRGPEEHKPEVERMHEYRNPQHASRKRTCEAVSQPSVPESRVESEPSVTNFARRGSALDEHQHELASTSLNWGVDAP